MCQPMAILGPPWIQKASPWAQFSAKKVSDIQQLSPRNRFVADLVATSAPKRPTDMFSLIRVSFWATLGLS